MPARVVIDTYAYHERQAIILADCEESNDAITRAVQIATVEAYNTPFALAATAMANGDDGLAKELCRREQARHGRQWAVDLWREIESAVRDT